MFTQHHTEPAMVAAFAAIEARGNAYAARASRIASDPRIVFLKALLPRQHFADGVSGGKQVFAHLFSVEAVREARVRELICARLNQLDGLHRCAKARLALAAEHRREAARRKGIWK